MCQVFNKSLGEQIKSGSKEGKSSEVLKTNSQIRSSDITEIPLAFWEKFSRLEKFSAPLVSSPPS